MSDFPQYLREDLHFILGLTKWGHPILYTKAANAHPEKLEQGGEFSV